MKPRLPTAPRAIHLVERRRIDDTERRCMIFDQRNIDREVAVVDAHDRVAGDARDVATAASEFSVIDAHVHGRGVKRPARYSRAMYSAAIERPSVTSSRAISVCSSDSFHGTTSSSSGS